MGLQARGWGWRGWVWWVGVMSLVVGVRGQQCPETNVAVVVVASVFGTLAVVLLVVGLVVFFLWRRRKALLGAPKKTHKAVIEDGQQSPGRDGYVNQAFSDGGNISSMEEGLSNYVPCQEGVSPKSKKSNRDSSAKTWTSLPRADIPDSLQRQGSCGSLDNNYLSGDGEEVSVWLQSQDFIGLGFNISGSMRDGMYISHVHNRGPAIESNRVKVGDRIRSVTISFDHIVYEDALTILSYASPYPVKLTLQKERVIPTDPRLSESSDHLNHPLYRSQSMDALQRISKDPSYRPKRHYSEMKSEARKGRGVIHKLFSSDHYKDRQDNVFADDPEPVERKQQARRKDSSPDPGPKLVMSDVTVHMQAQAERVTPTQQASRKTSAGSSPSSRGELRLGLDVRDGPATGGIESDKENQEPGGQPGSAASLAHKAKDAAIREAAAMTAHVVEVEGEAAGQSVSVPPAEKSPPPFKPERKKKKSSNVSVSSSDSRSSSQELGPDGSPVSPTHVVLEDAIVAASAKTDQALPSTASVNHQAEVAEDEIVPEAAIREKLFDTEEIKFVEVDLEDSSQPLSPQLDMAFEFIEKKELEVPEGDPVEEEVIQAIVAERKTELAPLPRSHLLERTELAAEAEEEKLSGGLDDETLEQIIAMNSRPIELPRGLSGKNTKEKQSGLSYDITVADLDRAESQLRSEVQANAAKRAVPKGGLAFEVRDDVVSGRPVSIELNTRQVKRAKSYDTPLEQLWDKDDKLVSRSESFKRDKQGEGEDAEGLGWSGKRLVRAGSFSNIPQDDLVQDWTDPSLQDGEDEEAEEDVELSRKSSDDYIGSDSDTDRRKMTRADNIFAARENLANLSDLTDSNPSSRGSSPVHMAANGQDDGLGTSPELSPLKSSVNILAVEEGNGREEDERPATKKQAGQSLSLALHASYNSDDDDAEC